MFEREKHVAYNANAYAAGRVLGVDPVEQISKRCIRIVKMSEPDVSACVLCRWIILCLLMHNKFVIVLWKSIGWLSGHLVCVLSSHSCHVWPISAGWMRPTLFYYLFIFNFFVFITSLYFIFCVYTYVVFFFFLQMPSLQQINLWSSNCSAMWPSVISILVHRCWCMSICAANFLVNSTYAF